VILLGIFSMRDDLLDAQACADWAITQINILRRHLIAWDETPPYRIVTEAHSEPGKKVLRLRDVMPIHPLINAQVGAMINSIRSSLDLLVNRLAKRAGYAGKEDAYFPICRSRDEFFIGKHAGRKAIKRLSTDDRRVIEELEPWNGGKNPLIYALHDLDVTRKHRRLIAVSPRPQFAKVTYPGRAQGWLVNFEPTDRAMFENDAELGIVDIEADDDQIELVFDVRLDEAGPLADLDIMLAIQRLANTARTIIALFDT
jgi:hypothetical protein